MSGSSPGEHGERPGHFLDELRATFANGANRPAIIQQDRSWTYGEIETKARRCAARLRQLGVNPGDRVAIVTSEKLPFLAAHLGTLYASGVSLPLNPRFTADELRYFLQDSGARVVVAGPDVYLVVDTMRPDLPGLRSLMLDAEAWEAPEGEIEEAAIDRNAGCLMLYSSGTTGRPKGVLHSHANLASSVPRDPGVLAIHSRRRPGQRPAPVPHPRTLVRHARESLDGRLHGHRGIVPSPTDAGGRRARYGLHGDPYVLLYVP